MDGSNQNAVHPDALVPTLTVHDHTLPPCSDAVQCMTETQHCISRLACRTTERGHCVQITWCCLFYGDDIQVDSGKFSWDALSDWNRLFCFGVVLP